jgi:hypothetical protein
MVQDAFADLEKADLPLLNSEAFVHRLADAVAGLIAHQPSELYRLFYRRDLAEKKVMGLMLNTPAPQVALALARLLIDREVEKLVSRQQHRPAPFDGEEAERW